jgi:hypothetical protein
MAILQLIYMLITVYIEAMIPYLTKQCTQTTCVTIENENDFSISHNRQINVLVTGVRNISSSLH